MSSKARGSLAHVGEGSQVPIQARRDKQGIVALLNFKLQVMHENGREDKEHKKKDKRMEPILMKT